MAQNVTFLCGNLAKVQAKAVDNGQLLFATDSKQLFLDNSGARIEITEVVHVDALPNVSEAITNKFYYVNGSNILAISDGTKWTQVNAQSTIETGETAGTIKVNGTEVAVAGLGTAAQKNVEDFEVAGEAAKVLGTEADTSDKATVHGVKALANEKVASVTAADKSVTIGGTATAPTVGVTISTTANNYLSLDANGLYVPTPSEAVKYTVKKEGTASNDAIATYQLYAGETAVGDKIDIPKDYLVKSATLNKCDVDDTPAGFTAGQKYIDFVINSKDGSGNESHIYLNVSDLIDMYEAGDAITVSGKTISVNVNVENGLSITDNKIALAVATADTTEEGGTVAGTAGAMSSADKTKLDGIAPGAEVNYVKSVEGALTVDETGKLTIADATTSASGTMSATDKTKLDGIAEGAEVNVVKSVEGALSVSDTGALSVATADATKGGIISKETFSKIDGVESGAQVNKIETISFNGTDVAITDKKATINLTWVEL